MPRFALIFSAGLLIVPPSLLLQGKATTAAITAEDMRTRLFKIADDSMLGRETGSRGASLTADYVASEFKRLGLQAKGENGTWFQTVPFYIATAPTTPLSIVGEGALRAGGDYILATLTSVKSPATMEVIYGGAANDPATWIDATKATGKLVLLDIRGEAGVRRDIGQANQITRAMNFAGAAGIAIARMDLMNATALATARYPIPRTDSTAAQAIPPVLWITPRTADRLLGSPVIAASPGTPGKKVSGALALHWAPVPYPARNVIGVLPGRDPSLRGEYVSLTAHNDHVGICSAPVDHDSMRAFLHVYRPMGLDTRTWTETSAGATQIRSMLDSMRKLRPMRADSVCNGADDDGSGTTAILELAEAFASMPMAQRPRRSILFVSHTAEERGLVGSKWFTDHATIPVDSIVAEIDEDMIGRGSSWDLPKGSPTYLEVVGARRLSNEFGDFLEAANSELKLPFVFNYEFDAPGHPLQYYCRADHYSYARYGIPAVAFSRGEHLDYHQVTDEPQYIDYANMQRVVTMVYNAATRIGNADKRPALDKPKGDPKARCVQ